LSDLCQIASIVDPKLTANRLASGFISRELLIDFKRNLEMRSLSYGKAQRRGQGLVEYGLTLASIIIVVALALSALGTTTGNMFNSINSTINNAIGGVPASNSAPTPTPSPAGTRTDVALSGIATASSSNPGRPASFAIDGDDASNWQCGIGGYAGSWLQVDLGSASAIEGFRILTGPDGNGYAWQLQSSPDGTTWTTQFIQAMGTGYDVSGSFAPLVVARYWRMYMTSDFGESFLIDTLSLFATV
jgi:Flp pilus assembly pilin Flp